MSLTLSASDCNLHDIFVFAIKNYNNLTSLGVESLSSAYVAFKTHNCFGALNWLSHAASDSKWIRACRS